MAWQWTAHHRRDGAAAVDVDGVAGDTLGFAFDVPTGTAADTRTVQLRFDTRNQPIHATATLTVDPTPDDPQPDSGYTRVTCAFTAIPEGTFTWQMQNATTAVTEVGGRLTAHPDRNTP